MRGVRNCRHQTSTMSGSKKIRGIGEFLACMRNVIRSPDVAAPAFGAETPRSLARLLPAHRIYPLRRRITPRLLHDLAYNPRVKPKVLLTGAYLAS
jgi:hypothetical protein